MRDTCLLPIKLPTEAYECMNLVGDRWRRASGPDRELFSPYTGRPVGSVGSSTADDIADAINEAGRAAPAWAATPLKERVGPLQRFAALLTKHSAELANTVALESGKTPAEALAGIARGLEVVDFAISLPNADQGHLVEVSRGVTCESWREPLGVVAGVTPFNFPAMVPLWMFPMAIALGNAFVLKPSEKVPRSACRLGEWMLEAGVPPGIFSIVHGGAETVHALVQHPRIAAVGFVGSTPAARAVYASATAQGKRALCLGGAKNHLIAAPDADEALTVRGVVDSFTGCAGQRCMAASVLVVVGSADRLVDAIVRAAGNIVVGEGMGALIDGAALKRLTTAIERAAQDGATVALDGRQAQAPVGFEGGYWLGPTVLDHVQKDMPCTQSELFGPLLSILRVRTLDEALAIEAASPYGNATSIFTASGAVARTVARRTASGMVGVNVGVPVPRDPFSFGGTKESKFGQGDITGAGGIDLWTHLKKVTTRWTISPDMNWMS